MMWRTGKCAAALLAVGLAAGGCGSNGSEAGGGGGGGGVCPAALNFHHHTYLANPANAAVPTGNSLGHGRYPNCNDGHGATGTGTAKVLAIRGIDPALAVAVPSYIDGKYVWVEKHQHDPNALPPLLKRLLN